VTKLNEPTDPTLHYVAIKITDSDTPERTFDKAQLIVELLLRKGAFGTKYDKDGEKWLYIYHTK